MSPVLAFLAALLGTAFAVIVLRRLAPALDLLDRPGGRKQHVEPTPLVGGIAMFFAICVALLLAGSGPAIAWFLVASAVIALTGLLDDLHDIHQLPRLAAQIGAGLLMIFGAGIQLYSVGNLVGAGVLGLSFLAIPLTVFAAAGVINAINMTDGIDGLAGSVGLIAVTSFAVVAAVSGLTPQLTILSALAGALVIFLAYNLRTPWRRRAKIFMGDAGSLFMGFALAWFAVDLTQGPGRSFPPICALWIVIIPLCDTVSLILRRVQSGRSPMAADRQHLHDLLRAKGFSVGQTVGVIALCSIATSGIALGAWLLGLPEPWLFFAFVILFFSYHHFAKAAWSQLDAKGHVSVFPANVRSR